MYLLEFTSVCSARLERLTRLRILLLVYHSGSSASTRNRYVSVAGLHCAAATSGEISLNQVKIDTHSAATANRTGAVMSRAPVRYRDGSMADMSTLRVAAQPIRLCCSACGLPCSAAYPLVINLHCGRRNAPLLATVGRIRLSSMKHSTALCRR